jgi:hypothetical protein
MRLKSILFLLIITMTFQLSGQDMLASFKDFNDKWGYVDNLNQVVIKPIYRTCFPFHNGYAKIEGNKFINAKGLELIVPFKIVESRGFKDSLAAIYVNGKWGYLDVGGKMKIPNKYNLCTDFNGGFAIARIDEKVFVIDKEGNEMEISTPNTDIILFSKFSGGLAPIQIKRHGYWGFVNEKGIIIVEPIYIRVWALQEGMARVMDKYDKMGFVDENGNEVIELKFLKVNDFHNGYASARDGRKKDGYIDKEGKWKIEPIYHGAGNFDPVSGLARVRVKNKGFGYINSKGDVKFYENMTVFKHYSEGFCFVRFGRSDNVYIDSEGNKLNYQGIGRPFKNGYARIKVMGSWGAINNKGDLVIKPYCKNLNDFYPIY